MHPDSDHPVEPADGGEPKAGHGETVAGNRSRSSTAPNRLPVAPASQLIFQRIDPQQQPASDFSGEKFSKPAEDVCRASVDSSATDSSLAPTVSGPDARTDRPGLRVKSKRPPAKRPDPLLQSLMLLVTMAVMLTAARFAVPRIVEEIRYGWHRGELRAEYEAGTEGLKNVSLDALSDAYQMVTAAVGPSVVHIDVARKPSGPLEEQFASIPLPQASDQGSGVIVDEAGHILTNRHVIAEGSEIKVTLRDGRRIDAAVVGNDPLTDLALLKVNADRLIPITWGDSDSCGVGTPVWAVGSPFGLDQTVTFGILSGKHRMVPVASNRYGAHKEYQDFMQSDVAVNPGNSGGPLVDARGRLIGINTAIVGDTYQGVSFSIPSTVAYQVYQRLRDSGFVERGWLGVRLAEVPDNLLLSDDRKQRGALIAGIHEGFSPAREAGLKSGDLIVSVDATPVADVGHLIRMIGASVGGTTVEIGIARGPKKIDVPVRLGSRPQEVDER